MDALASFGRWLKSRRRTLDLTQDELARQVGCSVVTIRKLESDERRPSRQIAERLAVCLRIAPHERATFMGLARAEPYLDELPTPAQDPLPGPAPQRTRSNLPTPLTRLIGRKQEVAAVRSALLRGDMRLLTLLGPPGIGKTRLAVQAATELRDAFADGVFFVDLAAIRDPALVVGAIAQALGIREISGRPLAASVQDYLYDKRILLLLDNFEQVVGAAPLVVDLLEGGSGLKALVTSRATLHVRGEQVVAVSPLPLPDLDRPPGLRGLAQNPAVALFVERAQAVLPAFTLTQANAPVVAALCAHLDGLPLAIELVAVHAKLLPPSALLAGLDRRLALLTDGPRDLPLRHRTLRAALAGSYELLDSHEQALFRRLGVFVGGSSLAATEAVASELRIENEKLKKARDHTPFSILNSQFSILNLIEALVDRSLIVQRPPTDAAPRFTMLETIREYALELLEECGETAAVQEAHAAHFLDLAERAEPELHGPNQVAWLDLLEAEHPNLRAALEWMLQAGEIERALRLAGALWWLWSIRGYSSEGRRWLDRILDLEETDQSKIQNPKSKMDETDQSKIQNAQRAPESKIDQADQSKIQNAQRAPESKIDQADQSKIGYPSGVKPKSKIALALYAAGHLALFQGDFAAARARLGASVGIWRELAALPSEERRAQRGLFSALSFLMLAMQFEGDNAAREPLVAEYLTLSATLDDPASRAMLLFNEGRGALLQAGNYIRARAQLEQCLALFRPLGDVWYITMAVLDLGLVALFQEDYPAARTWYEEGLTLARVLKDRTLIAAALNNLGEVARCQDDDERAAQLYAESLQLHQDLGNKPEIPRLLHNLGYVALHRGEIAQATTYFRDSLARFQQLGMTRGVAENLAGFAAIFTCRGRPAEAARFWGAAEALHETDGTPVWPTDRREHARYQALARAQLDAASWDAAWQEGRTAQIGVLSQMTKDEGRLTKDDRPPTTDPRPLNPEP